MKKLLLIGLVAVPFLAGIAMAGQPKPLTDAQMDKVTAGQLARIDFPGGIEAFFFPNSFVFFNPPPHVDEMLHIPIGLDCTVSPCVFTPPS